jgi:PTH1 family peptidyl-tRNA hydrolase
MLLGSQARECGSTVRSLTKVIVGLGNPGERYARNRHNVGFMAVEALAKEVGGRNWSMEIMARTCQVEIGGCPVLLAEPLTYMNASGKAVSLLLSALQKTPQDLVLVLDDLNLPFGRIRIRERGSAGGHHGLESILAALESDEIVRVRLGIGEEQMPQDKAEFVLSDFPPERQKELGEMLGKAGNALKSILCGGTSKAMAVFNA